MTFTNVNSLLKRVEEVTRDKKLDLSSDEDLSIGVMNLISAEEHLFFTHQKTGKDDYLDLLVEVRKIRKELLGRLIKDYEGEVWCIEKHLLAASMRLIEVGTKYLSSGEKNKAKDFFSKAFKLYSLFWGINLKIVKLDDLKRDNTDFNLVNDNGGKTPLSLLDKLSAIVQKVVNCCKE